MRAGRVMGCWRSILAVGLLLVAHGAGAGTPGALESLPPTPGIHIRSYDGLEHRDSAHYAALCRIVTTEFGIEPPEGPLHLVFVAQDVVDRMLAANPGRFQGKGFTAVFIEPSLIIMIGAEEADDTFMHEYMHYLNTRGLLFADLSPRAAHRRIEEAEGMLLGSTSYLTYIGGRSR